MLKSKLRGDDIKPQIEAPKPSTAHTVATAETDGQYESTTTELEDRSEETIYGSDSEDTKTSSSAIKLIDERIMLQNKKASHLFFYTLKSPSELNEDQWKSVATLPIIQANIKELEALKKAIKSMETEEAKELEEKQAEDERAMQERMNQEFQLNRFSDIIFLIRLSAHLSSSGPNPLAFALNSNIRRIIQHLVKILTSFKGSQKDEVLSGLLKSEGKFEGLSYDTILFITNLYRNSHIVEELPNAEDQVGAKFGPNVAVDEDGSVEADIDSSRGEQSDSDSGPRVLTDDNSATDMESSEKMLDVTTDLATTVERGTLEDNAKVQAEVEALRGIIAELKRDKLDTTQRQEEEEEIRQTELEKLRCKLEESEWDQILWEEAARKQEEERQAELERLRCKLEESEWDRILLEETAWKREEKRQAELEQLRCKVEELEWDQLLLKEAAKKREGEAIKREEEAKKREEETIKRADIKESRRKTAESERDKLLLAEATRELKKERKRLEELRRKFTELEQDRQIWEEAARKRTQKEKTEESKRKLKMMERDKPWESQAAERKHL